MRRASGVAGAMERTPGMFGEGGKGTESQLGGEEIGKTSQRGNRFRSEGPHGPINPE